MTLIQMHSVQEKHMESSRRSFLKGLGLAGVVATVPGIAALAIAPPIIIKAYNTIHQYNRKTVAGEYYREVEFVKPKVHGDTLYYETDVFTNGDGNRYIARLGVVPLKKLRPGMGILQT